MVDDEAFVEVRVWGLLYLVFCVSFFPPFFLLAVGGINGLDICNCVEGFGS